MSQAPYSLLRSSRLKSWIYLAVLAAVVICPTIARAADAAPAALGPVEMKPEKDINSGDTAWMLASSALVLLMTGPALALFYGGLVRRKNVLATMMQSFILMAIVSVVW